ncbi:MAG: hypothetical protein U0232_00700 [Thermomicrobiales bacterium]
MEGRAVGFQQADGDQGTIARGLDILGEQGQRLGEWGVVRDALEDRGLAGQEGFGLVSFGGVAVVEHDAADARFAEQVGAAHFQHPPGVVGVSDAEVADLGVARLGEEGGEEALCLGQIGGMEAREDVAADQFAGVVADDRGGCGALVEGDAIRADDGDAIGGALDEGAEMGLAVVGGRCEQAHATECEQEEGGGGDHDHRHVDVRAAPGLERQQAGAGQGGESQ